MPLMPVYFRRVKHLLVLICLVLTGSIFQACQTAESLDRLDELRPKAEQGDANAQLALGIMYKDGEGVAQDHAEAARWFRLAADQGDPEAQWELGHISEDDAEAVRWWRLAAGQGYVRAQLILGRMYDNGWDVPQDDIEAVRWYRLAADQGDASAQSHLAIMYQNGKGVPQDYVQAHIWFDLAASRRFGGHRQHDLDGRDRAAGQMNPTQIAEARRLAREWEAAHPRD